MGKYNETDTCDICKEKGITTKIVPGNVFEEMLDEKFTGRRICKNCYEILKLNGNYGHYKKMYNGNNCCKRCGRNFDDVKGFPHKEIDINGNFIGWDCRKCYENHCPNSYNNKTRLKADIRNKRLDPNSNVGRGYITCVVVKKKLGVKDCYDITGNFNFQGYDLIDSEQYGLVDAKGSLLRERNNSKYHLFNTKGNRKANYFICIGYDKDRKNIVVYIIPNIEDIQLKQVIAIPYNSYRSKYYKYRVDEEELKIWNDIYHSIDLEKCPVLRSKKKK